MTEGNKKTCWACGSPVESADSACAVCRARQSEAEVPPARRARLSCLLWTLVLGTTAIATLVLLFLRAGRKRHEEDCRAHLRGIGFYFSLYRDRFHQEPSSFRDICRPEMATDKWIFICPFRPPQEHIHDSDLGLFGPYEQYEHLVGYDYKPPPAGAGSTERWAVAWDRAPHPDGRRCVLFIDGTVEILDEAGFSGRRAVR